MSDERSRKRARHVEASNAAPDSLEATRAARELERARPWIDPLPAALARVVEHANGEAEAREWLKNIAQNLGRTIPESVVTGILARIDRRGLRFIASTEPAPTRWCYTSGEATVSLRFNERCAHNSCQASGGSMHGRGCYHGKVTVPSYDWRTKKTSTIVWRFAHLHLSAYDQSRLAVDSDEAIQKAARCALSFAGDEGSTGENADAFASAPIQRQDSSGEIVLDCERYDSSAHGGYPIVYTSSEGEDYCGKCAPRFVSKDRGSVYYEGAPIECADCGTSIESAYGNPDEDQETGEIK